MKNKGLKTDTEGDKDINKSNKYEKIDNPKWKAIADFLELAMEMLKENRKIFIIVISAVLVVYIIIKIYLSIQSIIPTFYNQ